MSRVVLIQCSFIVTRSVSTEAKYTVNSSIKLTINMTQFHEATDYSSKLLFRRTVISVDVGSLNLTWLLKLVTFHCTQRGFSFTVFVVAAVDVHTKVSIRNYLMVNWLKKNMMNNWGNNCLNMVVITIMMRTIVRPYIM